MSKVDQAVVDLFTDKAQRVSTQVVTVKNMAEAMEYAMNVCEKKEPCKLYLPDNGKRQSGKTIAAPGLDEKDFTEFEKRAKEKGFAVLRKGMRDYLAGIDVSFTIGDYGIAETATSVVASEKEDTRLSGMICEIHVIALPKSKIVKSSYDAVDFLRKVMSDGPMYTAFISGSSRTSDIERVLTTGVHGPLELHVALVEE